jgi:hypothetical protein
MASQDLPEPEPGPLPELAPLEEGDFHGLSPGCGSDPQFNDRRLVTRRKLLSIAKAAAGRTRVSVNGGNTGGKGSKATELDARTSLHHPHRFNGMRVERMWAYLCRGKAEKTRLRKVLGADLAKDLDAAYRNAYLCVALESDALEVSLRIHADAWYDGQNLLNRVRAEGVAGWRGLLDELVGYRLRLADWKGEWKCGELTPESLEEFLGYYKPGEQALVIEHRTPCPPGSPARAAAFADGVPEHLIEELARLVPLYRFTAWSKESDFLFPG